MGYRSCVAYKIVFHDSVEGDTKDNQGNPWRDLFFSFLAEAKAREDTMSCFGTEGFSGFEVLEDDLTIRFQAENVKWYEDYPEVQCHEALLNLAKEYAEQHAQEVQTIKDDGMGEKNQYSFTRYPLSGVFVRVGENVDDNDEDSFGEMSYGECYITRSIQKDW